MKRLLLAAFCMVVVCAPCTSQAQSREDALRLHKEAYALQNKARSNDDLKKAVQKYEEALKIYQRVGDAENSGIVCNKLGIVYYNWGQCQTVAEYHKKGLEIARKIGEVWGGRDLMNLGIVVRT